MNMSTKSPYHPAIFKSAIPYHIREADARRTDLSPERHRRYRRTSKDSTYE